MIRRSIAVAVWAMLLLCIPAFPQHNHGQEVTIDGRTHPEDITAVHSLFHWMLNHRQDTPEQLKQLGYSSAGTATLQASLNYFSAGFERVKPLEHDARNQQRDLLVRGIYNNLFLNLSAGDMSRLNVMLENFKSHITASARSTLLDPQVTKRYLAEAKMMASMVPQSGGNECSTDGGNKMCADYEFSWEATVNNLSFPGGNFKSSTGGSLGSGSFTNWTVDTSGGTSLLVGAHNTGYIRAYNSGGTGPDAVAYVNTVTAAVDGCMYTNVVPGGNSLSQMTNWEGPAVRIQSGAKTFYSADYQVNLGTTATLNLNDEVNGTPKSLGTYTWTLSSDGQDIIGVCANGSGITALVYSPNVADPGVLSVTNTDITSAGYFGVHGIPGNSPNGSLIYNWYAWAHDPITYTVQGTVTGDSTCVPQCPPAVQHTPIVTLNSGNQYGSPVSPTTYIDYAPTTVITEAQLATQNAQVETPSSSVNCQWAGSIFIVYGIASQGQEENKVGLSVLVNNPVQVSGPPLTYTYSVTGENCTPATSIPDWQPQPQIIEGQPLNTYKELFATLLFAWRWAPLYDSVHGYYGGIPWNIPKFDPVWTWGHTFVGGQVACSDWDHGHPATPYWPPWAKIPPPQ